MAIMHLESKERLRIYELYLRWMNQLINRVDVTEKALFETQYKKTLHENQKLN